MNLTAPHEEIGCREFGNVCHIDVEEIDLIVFGPELKTSNAKISWKDVCIPKTEGGLGIRQLKEVNVVNGLKLIWRMHSGKAL
ncbi:hypothetical protein Bca4012_072684 [Brassica carinata]